MQVLFLTTVLPGAQRTGGEVVSQSVITALRDGGHDVTVLGYTRPDSPAALDSGEERVGVRIIETSDAGVHALSWAARALAGSMPYSVAKYRSKAYLKSVRRALGAVPALVVIDHAQLHFLAGSLSRPLVFIAHNAEGPMYRRFAADARSRVGSWANRREARLIGRAEAELAATAGQVWTLTEEDREYFRSACATADVRTLQVASDVRAVPAAQPSSDVALIGSWGWQANAAGLRWFSDEVVPHMASGVTVEVAGSGCEWLRGRHPNVLVRGVVPDAREFLSRARVVAVPSLAGGGVQVKTLDAVASGLPVVATGVAVRGLSDLPRSVAVADDAESFARAVERLARQREHDDLRADALAWSRARRSRMAATVTRWIGEFEGDERPLTGHAERGPSRAG